MGFRHLALFCLMLCAAGAVKILAQGTSDIPGSSFKDGYIGIRDKKTDRIIGVLYAKSGNASKFQDVRFDVVKKELPKPTNLLETQIYPVGCDSTEVVQNFWAKYPHSQAIMESPEAVLHLQTRTITGDSEIRFYSPDADMYGIGYDFNYGERTLHIHSNVRIVLRPKEGSASPFSMDFLPPAEAAATDSNNSPSQPKGSK